MEWDTPAGPEGSTVRHLAAHASGLVVRRRARCRRARRPGGSTPTPASTCSARPSPRPPGSRSPTTCDEAVCAPLGLTATRLEGSPAADAVSTAADLARFAAELQAPTLVHADTLRRGHPVAFPGLDGILPGYGRQKPNDWGLGFEIRDGKSPHWTGSHSSPRTFGHFGQSGTFLWVDPDAGGACVALTDRDFGEWSEQAWPPFTDGVLAAL